MLNKWPALFILLMAVTATADARQKVGLVLEGGGALGFAHIGVIQWLEENHVPIDAVAGTSMGGLVGGLYASGMGPAEIQEMVGKIDWNSVLRGQTPFQDLSYRRKEDRVSYPNHLEFGLRGGLGAPSGLNSGQAVDAIIDRALLPYSELKSFDDLPIPFRCVATDLGSGQAKVFDSGSLAQALRATMSIPAVFSPAKDGTHVYSDGGSVDNLPVDIAKKMGVDIVIAVFLDTGPVDPKSYNSALGIAGRAVSIMISANEMRNIQLADILLAADVKGFGAEDFTKSAQIIPKGVDAAARKKALLGNLSAPGTAWDSYIAARSARRQTGVPVPEFISATGTGPKAERAIESALSFSLHKPADPERIDAALNVLAGKGSFNSLSYGLIKRDGTDGLLIRAEEKSYGPPFLNLGLTIDGSDPNDVRLGVGARLTFMNFGGYGSEWRTDLFFGTAYGVNTEYYHPFTPGSPWFVAARGSANRSQFDVYNNKNRVAQYGITRAGAGADLGYRLGRLAEVRLGEDAVLVSGTLRIGEPIAPNGSRTLSDTSIRFQYFGQDDVILPHEGLIQQTRFDHFSNGSSGGAYNSFQEQSSYFIPTTSRGSIVVSASGGSSFGAKQLGLESFSLGGPFHLGAYGINELLGNQYFLAQAGYYRKLFDLNPLLGGDGVYALALYEAGKVYGNPVAPHLPMDGSVALVAKTALGPVYIGGSASGSRFKWWFGLGRVF